MGLTRAADAKWRTIAAKPAQWALSLSLGGRDGFAAGKDSYTSCGQRLPTPSTAPLKDRILMFSRAELPGASSASHSWLLV